MDHPLFLPIVLQLIGVIVIVAEILIPSGGILALIATAAFGYSLYSAFSSVSTNAGIVLLIADLILIPILVVIGFKFLAKSPVTLKKQLSSGEGVKVQKSSLSQFLGAQGEALTDLRPAGIAIVNNERLDVVTEGKYLDKGSSIIVVSVTGNQVIVKANN